MKNWYFSSILGLFLLLCQFSNVNAQSWKELMDSTNFYQEKWDLQTALVWAEKALPKAKAEFGELDTNYAITLDKIAEIYYFSGNYSLTYEFEEKALSIFRVLFTTDHPLLAKSIDNMQSIYQVLGNYDKAKILLEESLEMRRRLFKVEHPDLASSINNMACFFNSRGNYKQAEPLFKEALEMTRRIFQSDHAELAQSISNMAIFYNDIGDYKQAEPLLKEALEMSRRIFKFDHPDLANSISNMAFYYTMIGDNQQAEPLLKEALEMKRIIYQGDHPDLANSISNMAFYYIEIGNFEQAELLLNEAMEMSKRIFKGDHPNLAANIDNLANFYAERGDYEKAEPLFKVALEMYRRIYKTDHPDLAVCINNMAKFFHDQSDFDQAEPLYKEALSIYKNMLDDYFPSLSESEKKFFWNTVSYNFESFNSFAVQRSSVNPLIISNMYDIQLYTKSLLFNSTSKIKKRIINSNDLDLIDKYNEFSDKKELLVRLYTMTEDERKHNRFNTDSIEKITNELEKELSLQSELYTQSYDKKKITWKTIQAVLKPDEVAIEVVRFRYKDKNGFADTIYYAFLIVTDKTEEHPDIVFYENGKELENEYYTDYRMMINAKIEDKQSYARYWGKLEEKLKGYKKIYFSADGIYNKLNPVTLLKPNGKYLLEEYDIQQVNSTKDLLMGYYKSQQESNIYNNAVLIGNPNFSLSESKVRKTSQQIRSQVNEDKIHENEVTNQLIANSRGIVLKRLPRTKKEVKDIEKFLKRKNWVVNSYLGDMALKTAVKSVNNPRILHIATHGMFLEDVNLENKETFGFETKKVVDNPLLRSGLFFAGADNYLKSDSTKLTGDENGLLTAYEAMNLDLDKTELVVLSACETGLGEVKNGEGVFGLRRAFQQAGAKTVIMSLWAVNDDATQKLMTSFYSNWVTGMTKREAFSNAQQEVLKQYPEPYYWGAFVMVGE